MTGDYTDSPTEPSVIGARLDEDIFDGGTEADVRKVLPHLSDAKTTFQRRVADFLTVIEEYSEADRNALRRSFVEALVAGEWFRKVSVRSAVAGEWLRKVNVRSALLVEEHRPDNEHEQAD